MRDPGGGAGAGPAAGATRERILHAAGRLYARHGFARVSMRMVALSAGVTKPALYYHFKDKQSLFEECLQDFNHDLGETMRRAARRDGDMAQRIRAVAEALLTGSPFHPVRVHEELADRATAPLRDRLRQTFQTVVVAPVTELFETMQRDGHLREGVTPAVAAGMLIGVCMAFLQPAREEEGAWRPLPLNGTVATLPPAAAASLVSDLVLAGLAPR